MTAASASGIRGGGAAVAMLGGVLVGSMAWFTALSLTLWWFGRRRTIRTTTLALVDVVSGTGIVGFGGALGWRTWRDR